MLFAEWGLNSSLPFCYCVWSWQWTQIECLGWVLWKFEPSRESKWTYRPETSQNWAPKADVPSLSIKLRETKWTISDPGAKLWHCYGQEQCVQPETSLDHFQHINSALNGSTCVRTNEENRWVLQTPTGVCCSLGASPKLTQTCKNAWP